MTAQDQLQLAFLIGASNRLNQMAKEAAQHHVHARHVDPATAAALGGLLGPLGPAAYGEWQGQDHGASLEGLRMGGRSLAEGLAGAGLMLPAALLLKNKTGPAARALVGAGGAVGSAHGAYEGAVSHNERRPILDKLLGR